MLTICISRKARVVLVFRTILPERLLTPLSSALFTTCNWRQLPAYPIENFVSIPPLCFSVHLLTYNDQTMALWWPQHTTSTVGTRTLESCWLLIKEAAGAKTGGRRADAKNPIAHVQKIRSRMCRKFDRAWRAHTPFHPRSMGSTSAAAPSSSTKTPRSIEKPRHKTFVSYIQVLLLINTEQQQPRSYPERWKCCTVPYVHYWLLISTTCPTNNT